MGWVDNKGAVCHRRKKSNMEWGLMCESAEATVLGRATPYNKSA